MTIEKRNATTKAGAEMFTGDVWIDPIVSGVEPSRVRVNAVHFTPGARTAWHSHAIGQTLVILEGAGYVQDRGESVVEIGAGDVVTTASNVWHWHGATADRFMTHLSITEGTGADGPPEALWGEHVTDEEYPD